LSTSERKTIGVIEVLILLGLIGMFAYYFLLIIGYPFVFPMSADSFARRMVQLMSFIGITVGALFALRHPRDYAVHAYTPAKTIIWGLVGCIPPVLLMLEACSIFVPVPASGLAYAVAGFGAGYFIVGWEDLSSRGRVDDTLVIFGSAMIAALAVMLLVVIFMDPVAQGVMGILLMAMNLALFYGVSVRREFNEPGSGKKKKGSKDKAEEEEEVEDKGSTFNHKLSALLLITNIPLGFLLPMLYELGSIIFFVAIGVALVSLIVFVLCVRLSGKNLTFINLLRGSIGAASVALLIAGININWLIVTCVILFSVWVILRLAHGCTLVRLTRVQKVSPVFLTVRGKLPAYAGFILGFIINNIIFNLTLSDSALVSGGLVLVAVLIVSALILFPFSQNYSKQLDVVPVVVDVNASSPDDIEHAKCAELAKRYGLSPREEEILFYIVKGRNAHYIAEKLVISESTAKTHIHNIYKKSGIHSQQKFIDIMDELV
jgi:DNA-binding CsgD family transcriptional regulator/MFS family permease